MFLHSFGRFMGWVILTFYILAALNYILKFINKRWISKLPRDSKLRKNYTKVLQFFIKAHPWLGYAAFASVIVHFTIQFRFYGFNVTGFIAGTLMLIQIGIGSFGQWIKKRKRGNWFLVHRGVTLALLVFIAIHIISAIR